MTSPNKRKDTPLLLKGRIFLNNVTQAIPSSNRNSVGRSAGIYSCHTLIIFFKLHRQLTPIPWLCGGEAMMTSSSSPFVADPKSNYDSGRLKLIASLRKLPVEGHQNEISPNSWLNTAFMHPFLLCIWHVHRHMSMTVVPRRCHMLTPHIAFRLIQPALAIVSMHTAPVMMSRWLDLILMVANLATHPPRVSSSIQRTSVRITLLQAYRHPAVAHPWVCIECRACLLSHASQLLSMTAPEPRRKTSMVTSCRNGGRTMAFYLCHLEPVPLSPLPTVLWRTGSILLQALEQTVRLECLCKAKSARRG